MTNRCCVEYTHHPANPLLGLLSVTHVYEATAGESIDGVFGSEFRVVDVARDEISDDCRHPVYRGREIKMVLGIGGKNKRTLGIEKNSILLEMRPLKHTLQFLDVLLSIRGHCVDMPSAHHNPTHRAHIHCLSSPMNTTFLKVVVYLAKIGK